jgi:hypothetical protein
MITRKERLQKKKTKQIKSLGYQYGLDCKESMCWMAGMQDNFQSDKPDINEIQELMNAFKKMNSIEFISDEDREEYRDIILTHKHPDSELSLKYFLDGYLDFIYSDLLQECFEYYEIKNS